MEDKLLILLSHPPTHPPTHLQRRPKNDAAFDALGATDELNAAIGLAKEFARSVSLPPTHPPTHLPSHPPTSCLQ